jgi:hypothetical protein
MENIAGDVVGDASASTRSRLKALLQFGDAL